MLGDYLKSLFHNWFAAVGALSLIAFFVPVLAEFWQFLAAVALLAFIAAGFRVYQQQEERRVSETESLRGETESLRSEIERLRQPRFTAEIRQEAERQLRALAAPFHDALRQLLIAGQMTDHQMHDHLLRLGHGGIPSALQGLSNETTLVVRTGHTEREYIRGYQGPYAINDRFREVLEELLQSRDG